MLLRVIHSIRLKTVELTWLVLCASVGGHTHMRGADSFELFPLPPSLLR